MKRSKKVLSLLLSVIMVVCLLSGLALQTNAKQSSNCLANLECTDEGHYTGNQGDSRVFRLDGEYFNGYNPGGYIENGVAVSKRNGNVGVDGTVYENGFEVWIARWNFGDNISWAYRTFKLEGKYHILTGKSGLIKSYNTKSFDDTVYFYNGSDLIYSFQVTPSNYNFEFSVNVEGVDELKVEIKDNTKTSGGTSFALYDLFLDGAASSGNKYPSGYNFLEDSYNFANYSDNISKKYFTTLFGSDKGKLLYKENHKAGGLCFGFAYTTAAIYNNYPNINTIATRTGLVSTDLCEKIRDIHHQWSDLINDGSGMFIGEHFLSIEDYIKYAYIYQFSKTVVDNSVWYNDDTVFAADELLQLVKDTTDNNMINVTIGMSNKTDGGHRVLAVGYDGNDILIDDPNNTESLERITVNNDGTWSFSGLNNWNSNTCYIRSNIDVQSPYRLLSSGQTTTASTNYYSDGTEYTENYMEGMDIVDADCNLVSISTDNFKSIEKLTQVTNAETTTGYTTSDSNLYWTNKNVDSLTLSDFSNDNVEVEMAGNGSIISASAEKLDEIKLNTENKSIAINTDKGSSCSVSFETCTESKDYKDVEVKVVVTGTSISNDVNATQTDNGLNISGLEESVVTLSINDEVIKSVEYNDNDGVFEIIYDSTGDSDTLEVKADVSNENTCKFCDKDHGTSFFGKLIAFFHKIAYFFAHLFGRM